MKLAEKIADYLFMNGCGQKAKRLILELEDGKDGGGWSKTAVITVINRYLASQQVTEADGHKQCICPSDRSGYSKYCPVHGYVG